ncbi:unnamed protein product [Linum trigynum]|uniref:Reverse transcriptase domain-containing protein n=1 Tax=Linum trigynum TaxID=586398 RepID=A0AAV2DFS7_9ROSI
MDSFNKLISNVLSRRLRVVIPYLVSHNQQASVMRRHIGDAAITVFELVDSCRKSGLMFKMDIDKAFDKVNWNSSF